MLETLANGDILSNDYESNSNTSTPEQSEEEQAEIKKLMRLFHTFKRYRKRYDKKWINYYKLFRGCQWDYRRPSWKNSEVVNMIWQTIQSQIPIQTDVRPRFSFLPQEPTDREFAKILDDIADSDFERKNWLRTVFNLLLDGWIYGTGIASMHYNEKLQNGLGDNVFYAEDIFNFFPHPDADTINDEKSECLFVAIPTSTAKLKRQFPDKAQFINRDISDRAKKDRSEINGASSNYFNSDRELAAETYGDSDDETLDDIPRTLVFHYYAKPQDVQEIEDEIEDDLVTGEKKVKKYRYELKYPNGRYVIIANNMILHDGPLPYQDGLFPFAKYNNYILPREFWGVSECEQLESPQLVFNKILSFSLDALAITGNPIWVVDSNSEVDTDNLNNIPGAVVEKNPGTEVRREPGLGINPSAINMLNNVMGWFNNVAGQSEFSQGDVEGGITAASAIEQLIRASRTRIRQKMRNLDECMRDAGRLYMHRIFEFYSVPRIYRMTNDQGAQSFRKFRVETNEQGKRVAITSKFTETSKGLMEGPEKSIILEGDLDVRVITGSELPFDVADNERKALSLFDRGIIDAEEVLDRIQYPNKEKVLERLAQAQQAAAQQQQAKANQPKG